MEVPQEEIFVWSLLSGTGDFAFQSLPRMPQVQGGTNGGRLGDIADAVGGYSCCIWDVR